MFEQIVNFDQPQERSRFIARVQTWRGRKRIEASDVRARRSDRQNRYYHPCFVEPFRQYLADQGERYSHDEAHEILAMQMLGRDVADPRTGEVLGRVRPSTASLDTSQFNDFLDRCAAWLAGFGIVVPEPNEYHERESCPATTKCS